MSTDTASLDAISALTARFYGLFNNEDGRTPRLNEVYEIFLPEGLIVKSVSDNAERYTLAQFVEPRMKLLTDGTLIDFKEWETSSKTEIFGDLAVRISSYMKRGVRGGEAFEASGVKTMQFVRTGGEWKMACSAWYDY